MSDYELALEHYRMLFPDGDALGEGSPPQAWKAEYDRLAKSGLSATLVTQTSTEGMSVSSQKNFDQKTLLRALHDRRAELDSDYQPFTPGKIRRSLGIRVRL
jgi:hypothetical protein